MLRLPEEYRSVVPPVPEGASRQTWSVMIPTYDCAQYLGETLASVLEQDPGPERMQVQVVDDHSSDDPEAVVRAVGGDRVEFFRQPRNVGHVRNFDTCLARSRGRLVHLLHGDDRVRPGFYETMQRPFELHPEIGAAFCRGIFTNESGDWIAFSWLERDGAGIVDGWLARLAVRQRLTTPAVVVRREVYERLGGFDPRLSWCEDWEMWVRIARHYPVWHEPEPLAVYRRHSTSSTSRQRHDAENVQDERRAIGIIAAQLPPEMADEIARRARRSCAIAAVVEARQAFAAGERGVARSQIREAMKTSRHPLVLAHLARFAVSAIGRTARRTLGARKLERLPGFDE